MKEVKRNITRIRLQMKDSLNREIEKENLTIRDIIYVNYIMKIQFISEIF